MRVAWILLVLLIPATMALTGGPADRSEYTFSDSDDTSGVSIPTFDPDNMAGSTALDWPSDTDSGIADIDIGFTFNYYGTDYTTVNANENGFLNFGTLVTGVDASITEPMPSSSFNNAIAGLWADYDAFGNICSSALLVKTTGDVGQRVTMIQYTNMRYLTLDGFSCDDTGPLNTFQFKLFETSNIIEVHIINAGSADANTWQAGAVSVVGIEKSDSEFLQYQATTSPEDLVGKAVRFRPVNSPHEAMDDSATTHHGTSIDVDFLANDAGDPDNANPAAPNSAADNGRTITITTAPTNGAASFVDNKLRYTPNAGYVGSDTVGLTFNDGYANGQSTSTVTIDMTNTAPSASTTEMSAIEDTEKFITLEATDADGDALTFALVTQPSKGTAALEGNTLTFTPTPHEYGTDFLVYSVFDGAVTIEETLNIEILAVNDPPSAALGPNLDLVPGQFIFNEAWATDITAGPLEDHQSYTWYLTPSEDWFATPPSIVNGILSFETDGIHDGLVTVDIILEDDGGTLWGGNNRFLGSFTIDIPAANLRPESQDVSRTINEDASTVVPLVAIDKEGDAVTYAFNPPTTGTLEVLSQDQLRFTPPANWHGVSTFTYWASDARGAGEPATVTITVTPVPDAPEVGTLTYYGLEGESIVFDHMDLLSVASDADGDELTIASVGEATQGTLTGAYTYTFAAVGETIPFTVSDGEWTGTGSLQLIVGAPNQPPSATTDTASLKFGDTLTIYAADLLANDVDPEDDPLQVLDLFVTGHTLDGSGPWQFAAEFAGDIALTYILSDGINEVEGTLLVTVSSTGPNSPPSVSIMSSATTIEVYRGLVLQTLVVDDGFITSTTWEIAGQLYEGEQIVHAFTEAGQYAIKVTVVDNGQSSDTAYLTVTAIPASQSFGGQSGGGTGNAAPLLPLQESTPPTKLSPVYLSPPAKAPAEPETDEQPTQEVAPDAIAYAAPPQNTDDSGARALWTGIGILGAILTIGVIAGVALWRRS